MKSDKKDTIIEVAQRLFSRFGLRKTTVDDIVEGARVGKGTLYHYFKSKEEVYSEVVNKETQVLTKNVTEAISREDTPEGKLKSYVLTKLKSLQQLANLGYLTRESIAGLLPSHQALKKRTLEEELNVIKEILTEGVEKGKFVVKNINLTALGIISAIRALEYPWVMGSEKINLEDSAEAMLGLLLKGIEAR